MDGVLFDSIGIAREHFMEEHPSLTEAQYKEIHSGKYYEEASKYTHLKKPRTEEEKKAVRAAYETKKGQAPLFAGIKDLLIDLHKNEYSLVINTSAYEKSCFPLLEHSGIKKYFDFIATAELSKDKVEKFKIIKDRYEVERNEIVFITDALGDLRDSDTAGIPTIAVTWGIHDKTFFAREKHGNLIGVVDTIEELNFLLNKTLKSN